MNMSPYIAWTGIATHVMLQVLFIIRALLRPHREPASRLAWTVVIATAPVAGIVAYVLFGDTNIGSRRIARMRMALRRLPSLSMIRGGEDEVAVPDRHLPLFRAGYSISAYPPVGDNKARLMADSEDTIDSIVADIDAARDHAHLLFYIWLADHSGLRMIEALKRAAARGVVCRVMVDDVGSRALIRSIHWQALKEAGVRTARALPVGNPLSRPLKGRIDMRNHRKIVVIDNHITYAGSQNCADAAFAPKARYAPWVDVMMRFEGPIARQNQHLFAADWMGHVSEDLSALLRQPIPPAADPGFAAQAIGTGATVRYSAMPEMFVALMSTARRELVISTPYYVPDEPIQAALCACARRGVATTIIVPRYNDSWIVAAASHSYYHELLDAGVRIYEFVGGLLHAKTVTMDGEIALIGSANLDRRSFELNSENNILFFDEDLTADLRRRQQGFIDSSVAIHQSDVGRWSRRRRLWNNTVAMFGPVL